MRHSESICLAISFILFVLMCFLPCDSELLAVSVPSSQAALAGMISVEIWPSGRGFGFIAELRASMTSELKLMAVESDFIQLDTLRASAIMSELSGESYLR